MCAKREQSATRRTVGVVAVHSNCAISNRLPVLFGPWEWSHQIFRRSFADFPFNFLSSSPDDFYTESIPLREDKFKEEAMLKHFESDLLFFLFVFLTNHQLQVRSLPPENAWKLRQA